MMAGSGVNMGGAGMLRTRRRDISIKPNRKLDRKSSRGMIYENEELRLRTIHINAEVEQGKLKNTIVQTFAWFQNLELLFCEIEIIKVIFKYLFKYLNHSNH